MRNIRLGVVANKVRNSMPAYQPLERFLKSLELPLVARLSDADSYLQAAETGVGIFESEAAECAQFLPIAEWVGGPQAKVQAPVEKVVPLRANDKLPPALHRSVPGIIRRIWQPPTS